MLDHDPRYELNRIRTEAIVANRHPDGSIDHTKAALAVHDELERLEAGGIRWAADARRSAELAGLVSEIKSTAKTATVTLILNDKPLTMPAVYARKRGDGQQLALWLDMPVDEAAELAEDIRSQSRILTRRYKAMRQGIDFAIEHGVDTVRRGFEAAGVVIEERAA